MLWSVEVTRFIHVRGFQAPPGVSRGLLESRGSRRLQRPPLLDGHPPWVEGLATINAGLQGGVEGEIKKGW